SSSGYHGIVIEPKNVQLDLITDEKLNQINTEASCHGPDLSMRSIWPPSSPARPALAIILRPCSPSLAYHGRLKHPLSPRRTASSILDDPPPAISCLGAFRTPAVGARG